MGISLRQASSTTFIVKFALALLALSTPNFAITNFLSNSGGETGDFSNWTITANGGSGWLVGYDPILEGTRNFKSSFEWDTMQQSINLTALGYPTTTLDASPSITFRNYMRGTRCNLNVKDTFHIEVYLKNSTNDTIATYSTGTLDCEWDSWTQANSTFTGYPAGLRSILFVQSGYDSGYCAGQYGTAFDNASVYFEDIPVPACQTPINLSGMTYRLNQSINISGATCLNITAENITLDCNGFSITGNNSSETYGIYSNKSNTAIMNCNISNFETGIYINGARGRINNSSAHTTSSSGIGIYIGSGATNSTIWLSNGTSSTSSGIYVGSSWNAIRYARTISNSSNAFRLGGSNNNSISHLVSSGSTAVYIYSSSDNNFTNSTATSTGGDGFFIGDGRRNTFANVTASGPRSGFYTNYLCGNNIIANSTISSVSNSAIILTGDSDSNTVYNNTLISPSASLLNIESGCSNNQFYWNNFTNTSGYYVQDADGSNFYNTTINSHGEGNIWHNVENGSVQIYGRVASNFSSSLYYGTVGSGYPYNSANSGGKLSGTIVDYAPLTSAYSACGVYSNANSINTLIGSSTTGGATCINVTAQNVTIDCNGFSITGNNASDKYGIYSNQFNTTVRNCIIRDFASAIYFYGATNGTVRNASATAVNDAINLVSSNYTLIANTTATATSYRAITLTTNSNFNTIANSTATAASGYTIRIISSSNNTFAGSSATSGDIEALSLDSSSGNTFANSTANATTSNAIRLFAGSNSNTISNCTLISGGTLATVASSSSGNRFYWNNFTATSGAYVDDANGANHYNISASGHGEGNIWHNVLNGSVQVYGGGISSYSSSFYYGSYGTGYPYNNTTAGGKLSGNVVDYAPLTSSALSPNITINSPSSWQEFMFNSTSSVPINVSSAGTFLPPTYLSLNFTGGSNPFYYYNNSSGANTANCTLDALTLSCYLPLTLNASNYTLAVFAQDSLTKNNSSARNFSVSSTIGNSTNITSSGLENVSITINGTNVSNVTNFTGVALVNITSLSRDVLSFNYNFSYSGLNLSAINITNSTLSGASYIEISGISPAGLSGGKNITIHNASSSYSHVCVLDTEGALASSISSSCTGTNETLLTCDGTASNGKWCNLTGTTLSIYNLTHSAAIQFSPPSSAPTGGSGLLTPSLSYSFNCTSAILTITAKSQSLPVSGLSIRLKDPAKTGWLETAATNAQGIAAFTITESMRYSAESVQTSGYSVAYISPFTLTLCAPDSISPSPITPISPLCSSYPIADCPSSCAICPPCEVCSSISCQTEEFCQSIGFNKTWWDSVQPKNETAPVEPPASQQYTEPEKKQPAAAAITKIAESLPITQETQQQVAQAAPPAISTTAICAGALAVAIVIAAIFSLRHRKKRGLAGI